MKRTTNNKVYEYHLKTVYVDETTHKKLKIYAASNDKSIKDVIRDMTSDL